MDEKWSEMCRESEEAKKCPPFFRQLLVAANPLLILISAGMTAGYSSILLPQLEAPDSAITLTEGEESWIASISVLPMTFGCVIGGVLMERWGRRTLHVYTCPVLLAGWLLLGFAKTYALLLAARFLIGLCAGLTAPSSMVFVAETSSPQFRGFLLSLLTSGLSIGMLIVHILGTYLPWQLTSFAICSVPALAFAVVLLVPESPVWLAGRMRLQEAERAFLWCRGASAAAREEMLIMFENQKQRQLRPFEFRDYAKSFGLREFYVPLVIVSVYFATTQLAGVNAIPFYSIAIMKDTLGGRIDSYDSMLILDAVRVANAVLASVLTKQMNRRSLTMLSGSGTVVSLLVLAAVLRFADNALEATAYAKLVLLVAYISFITVGLLPLPWTMSGELFSPRFKGLGSGISAAVSFTSFFVVIKSSPAMFKNLGAEGTFLLFGAFGLAGTVYLYFYLPETKDCTLDQIQNNFRTKNASPTLDKDLEASINK